MPRAHACSEKAANASRHAARIVFFSWSSRTVLLRFDQNPTLSRGKTRNQLLLIRTPHRIRIFAALLIHWEHWAPVFRVQCERRAEDFGATGQKGSRAGQAL